MHVEPNRLQSCICEGDIRYEFYSCEFYSDDKSTEKPSLEEEKDPISNNWSDQIASDLDAPLSQFNKTSHATETLIEQEIEKGNRPTTAYG